jgi:hypothetical protein
MNEPEPPTSPMTDPEARLEQALIDEFLKLRGHDAPSLTRLPASDRQRLQREASIYAAAKLAEIAARAHFVHELHGDQ